MTKLEAFQQSDMWDAEFNLPLSPQNNNPWFYLACAVRIMYGSIASPAVDETLFNDIMKYTNQCEKSPGLLNRWPNGQSQVSHDELIGACYLNTHFAKRCQTYLEDHKGEYNNTGNPESLPLEFNFYRFPWFVQFVKACAGNSMSLLSQALWAYNILWNCVTVSATKLDTSMILLNWVMCDIMQCYPLSNHVVKLWKWRLNKLGITPKMVLAIEPKQNPIMAELAPSDW
jgi:hypothetical protein